MIVRGVAPHLWQKPGQWEAYLSPLGITMLEIVVLGTSVVLQIVAALLALRLVSITGMRAAWLLIAAGVALMAVRRSITFFRIVAGQENIPPDIVAELVALSISVLMVAGIRYIAPVYLAVRQERNTSQKLANQNTVLAEVGRIISSSPGGKDVFQGFSQEVGKLIHFEGLRIRVVDWERDTFSVVYTWGVDSGEFQQGASVAASDTLGAKVLRSRSSLLVDEDFLEGDGRRFPHLTRFIATTGFRSIMLAPLVSRDTPIGILSMCTSNVNAYTAEDLRLAERIAVQISGAISSFDLYERLLVSNQQLQALSARMVDAQEQERRQIAKELHDEIGQILTGLSIKLETCRENSGETAIPEISHSQELVLDLMERVRESSLDLRPSHLDDLGILPALRWHTKRYSSQTGVEVVLNQSGLSQRFPADVETAAYRIVQEGLTNVARHAAVNNVVVQVRADDGMLNIQVQDDGLGFDLDEVVAAGTGLGISGMRERAQSLGGRVTIESTPGGGTNLTAILPFTNAPESN